MMEVLPPDVALFTMSTMDQAAPRSVFQTSSSSSPNSPEFYSFQKLLRDVYQSSSISLQRVERLRGHLHRMYTLRTTESSVFTLKCTPSRDTLLLRQEHKSLETEAKVLELIKSNTRLPVPQRVSFDILTTNSIGAPYLLRSYLPGTPLSGLLPYLSTTERSNIERTLGSHIFALTQIRRSSFGLVHRVQAGTGHRRWSEAFLSLLESVLRDGEDMLVSLPYDTIRFHAALHKATLDEITVPNLVALEAGAPRNVFINDRTRRIVGLLGFSTAVWGDPMMAGVFSGASDAFWEGYGGRPTATRGSQIRGLL
jgi:aminoglycoside phosphotransferase (APT) family kinase protein